MKKFLIKMQWLPELPFEYTLNQIIKGIQQFYQLQWKERQTQLSSELEPQKQRQQRDLFDDEFTQMTKNAIEKMLLDQSKTFYPLNDQALLQWGDFLDIYGLNHASQSIYFVHLFEYHLLIVQRLEQQLLLLNKADSSHELLFEFHLFFHNFHHWLANLHTNSEHSTPLISLTPFNHALQKLNLSLNPSAHLLLALLSFFLQHPLFQTLSEKPKVFTNAQLQTLTEDFSSHIKPLLTNFFKLKDPSTTQSIEDLDILAFLNHKHFQNIFAFCASHTHFIFNLIGELVALINPQSIKRIAHANSFINQLFFNHQQQIKPLGALSESIRFTDQTFKRQFTPKHEQTKETTQLISPFLTKELPPRIQSSLQNLPQPFTTPTKSNLADSNALLPLPLFPLAMASFVCFLPLPDTSFFPEPFNAKPHTLINQRFASFWKVYFQLLCKLLPISINSQLAYLLEKQQLPVLASFTLDQNIVCQSYRQLNACTQTIYQAISSFIGLGNPHQYLFNCTQPDFIAHLKQAKMIVDHLQDALVWLSGQVNDTGRFGKITSSPFVNYNQQLYQALTKLLPQIKSLKSLLAQELGNALIHQHLNPLQIAQQIQFNQQALEPLLSLIYQWLQKLIRLDTINTSSVLLYSQAMLANGQPDPSYFFRHFWAPSYFYGFLNIQQTFELFHAFTQQHPTYSFDFHTFLPIIPKLGKSGLRIVIDEQGLGDTLYTLAQTPHTKPFIFICRPQLISLITQLYPHVLCQSNLDDLFYVFEHINHPTSFTSNQSAIHQWLFKYNLLSKTHLSINYLFDHYLQTHHQSKAPEAFSHTLFDKSFHQKRFIDYYHAHQPGIANIKSNNHAWIKQKITRLRSFYKHIVLLQFQSSSGQIEKHLKNIPPPLMAQWCAQFPDTCFILLKENNSWTASNLFYVQSDSLDNWADIMNQVDYVVSVCSFSIHLANQLKKPAILLNKHQSWWLWAYQGAFGFGVPDYPNLYIIQQTTDYQWEPSLTELTQLLLQLKANP